MPEPTHTQVNAAIDAYFAEVITAVAPEVFAGLRRRVYPRMKAALEAAQLEVHRGH